MINPTKILRQMLPIAADPIKAEQTRACFVLTACNGIVRSNAMRGKMRAAAVGLDATLAQPKAGM